MRQNAQEIKEIKITDGNYPSLLREIPFPPKKISIWGVLPKRTHFISIVGTRRCSAYGREIVEKIIEGLARHDFATVSGFAVGIDTIVHRASIQHGVPTIAVLGSGLFHQVIYPQQNFSLAKDIISQGGCLISEYDYDMKATLWSFPQRNRIIAGLSPATLVVEAPEKSGALITARFALDQNRDVLAIPGGVFSTNAAGTNRLIKEGAALIESAEDILKIYGIEIEAPEQKNITLAPEEKLIVDCLIDPLDIDALIRKSKLPAAEAHTIVALLEIRGMIKKVGSEYMRTL